MKKKKNKKIRAKKERKLQNAKSEIRKCEEMIDSGNLSSRESFAILQYKKSLEKQKWNIKNILKKMKK